jgi:hypothetical protein
MKRKVALVAACTAVLVFVALGVSLVHLRLAWTANEEFADDLLASAMADTPLYQQVLSIEDREALAAGRPVLRQNSFFAKTLNFFLE